MLRIRVPMGEETVQDDGTIVNSEYYTLELEHSLVSLSKWESKFEKPFLTKEEKSIEESLWYVEAMCLNPDVPAEVFSNITKENIVEAYAYIKTKQTATWFSEPAGGNDKPNTRMETITAELIYYWMVAHKIPFECQYWHLNRLFTLISVCNAKNTPEKKSKNRSEALRQRRMLNEQRRQQYGTSG